MKVKYFIVPLLVCLLVVTGCGKKKENDNTTTTTTIVVKQEDIRKVDENGIVNDINAVSLNNNYELICEQSKEYYTKEQLENLYYNSVYEGGMNETLESVLKFYSDGKCRYATKYTYIYDNNTDFNKKVESITNRKVSSDLLDRYEINEENMVVINYVGTEYGTGDGSELYCYDWSFTTDEELKGLITSEIKKRTNQKCTLYRK